ncbi:MAG TPA: hypothetical protein VKF17_10970 [Isosphaeraceae bacterium]|nr:hypothetical protein [Isosphaeraceae bacterium]
MIKRTWDRPIGKTHRPWPAWLLLASCLCLLPIGCATLGDRGRALVPTRYQVRTGPFLVYSSTPIPADSPAIRCLHSLETDLSSRLNYHARPDEEPVEIYVLNDRNAYTHFLKFYYPELPPRRAFFLSQGERRVVYTYLSDRLEEDLRHEATHALVRGCYGDLPLWLDEGLAEYFETRTDTIDVQDEHMAKLPEDLKKGWTPDLPRLESLTDIHEMTPRDYRESWAWVHLMLGDSPQGKSLLIDYLNQGRKGPRPKPLHQILAARGTTGKTLVTHLEAVQSQALARQPEPPSEERLIRFQGSGPDVQDVVPDTSASRVAPPQRQGLLRRIGSWLGF